MKAAPDIWLIFGPSAVGKSAFGAFVAKKEDWLFVDVAETELVDFRGEWDLFYERGDAEPLALELARRAKADERRGCIVAFPTTVELHPRHAMQLGKVNVAVLYASAADCIHSFLERETTSQRNVDVAFWLNNNYRSYLNYSLPHLAPCRVNVFHANGKRRVWADIFAELRTRAQARK